jgi:hypothetical protein
MQEHSLQLATAPFRLGVDLVEKQAQPGNSATTSSAADLIPEPLVIDESHDFRLAQGLSQIPGWKGGRQIQQRPGDSRAGYATISGSVRERKPAISVSDNALRTTTAAI